MQIPFTADEINLIYQFGEQSKAETCAHLSAILPLIKDNDTKQIVCSTLKKLNVLSEETSAELTATTKRRKLTERDHSIKVRLSKTEKQLKEPTITEGKQNRIVMTVRTLMPAILWMADRWSSSNSAVTFFRSVLICFCHCISHSFPSKKCQTYGHRHRLTQFDIFLTGLLHPLLLLLSQQFPLPEPLLLLSAYP